MTLIAYPSTRQHPIYDDDDDDKVCVALLIIIFEGEGKSIWSMVGGRERENIHLNHIFFWGGGDGLMMVGGGTKENSLCICMFLKLENR